MLKEFFRDKSIGHLLMIGAVLLLFVSQFFLYFDEPYKPGWNPGSESRGSVVVIDTQSRGQKTGWELHPHAYVILVVLAFALLRDDIYDTRWFRRLGFWVCAFLIFVAALPGDPYTAIGATMGIVAVLLALVAAVLNLFIRKPALPQ